MKDFLKIIRFKILVVILSVMLGFMIMAVYSGGAAPLASQIISTVLAPAQRLSSGISGSVSGFFDKYLNAAKTHEENALLRQEVGELRRQLVDYEKAKHDLEQFQSIKDVQEQRNDLTLQTASVIAREHSSPFFDFTIDRGSLDNVAPFDPVYTADGLVGYVTEVGLTSSKVVTLLDVNINVGASNASTRDIGNITGTVDLAAQGLCLMEYLPRDSATKVGDIIVTSGGSLFPKDLIIGQVVAITTSSRGNSLEATIRPGAEIEKVKDVFVITHFEGQGVE